MPAKRRDMEKEKLNYLVVGTGGVGGSIAGLLALAGKQVACIARGAHLEAIREHGLRLKSGLKGEHVVPVEASTGEGYEAKADVVFVCVKGYSLDSVTDLIRRVAHEGTIVIPILNVYGTGARIQRVVPGVTVLDGCIYIVAFVSGPGEVTQSGRTFRIVYGARKGMRVDQQRLRAVQRDLQDSGIKADISDDIARDTFVKWSFISAMALTGAYYDVPVAQVQKPGEVRDLFISLASESVAVGEKLGIEFKEDMIKYHLNIIDNLSPESTTSLQKDLEKGHESEIQGLLFEMVGLAEEQGVEIPVYRRVAEKFQQIHR